MVQRQYLFFHISLPPFRGNKTTLTARKSKFEPENRINPSLFSGNYRLDHQELHILFWFLIFNVQVLKYSMFVANPNILILFNFFSGISLSYGLVPFLFYSWRFSIILSKLPGEFFHFALQNMQFVQRIVALHACKVK